ncbi:efflux RND transporter periplasmic adaptor subunit [Halopseudomonas aestusnigri]|uniref:Membrane fusion protein, multidrug efflux system n=1 Tax=Halopseudomonas aestusnigri TaxID=857252 RepID=A0AAQ1G933_9GAMM|nr:efflux RND transporter periplasmic adaptor subunit [Halopseudomonas aestusnigri]SEG62795.1 membrane fusion protein, multidrug efflux system [Halopseudomonas aestusnigri]
MNTHAFNAFARAGAAAALLLLLAGCDASGDQANSQMMPAPEVDIAVAQPRDVTLWDSFTGRMAAPETVALRARVSGYIDKVAFEEGELVKQGDVLFVIDQRPYQARLQMARAEVSRARSQVTLAAREAERAEQLWQRRAISREEMEQRSAARSMAQAALASAQAAQDNAELELAYTEVRAPVSGRMGRAEITRGNLATADATLLATLVSVDPMYVYFESDQQTVESNPYGDAISIPVRLGLGSGQDYPYQGQLDFVDNQFNAGTGTLQYRAVIANPEGLFRPGQFTRVQMPVAAARQAILIDQKAVLTDQDRRYVYVLDEQNRATRRFVETGRRVEGLLVIRGGLQAGDRVVVNGLQKILFPGIEVAPQLVAMDRSKPVRNEVALQTAF